MNAATHTYRIVVGVDGSDAARLALAWAAREAAARRGTIQAVTAWQEDALISRADARERAEQLLEREVTALHPGLHGAVPIALMVAEGHPGEALAAAAADADLLVIGSHGHSRNLHQLMGSVAESCIRHATCPVVVLPVPRLAPGHTDVVVPAATR